MKRLKETRVMRTLQKKKTLHNDHHIISAQPEKELCPVKSFKEYIAKINPKCPAFFQHYSDDKASYQNKPVGKNTLATLMKEISKDANLANSYTNHCIRKTTATGMHRQGFDLNSIQNVTKHKNLDSLKHYIGGPTYKEKKEYNNALLRYAENETPQQNKRKSEVENPTEIIPTKRVLSEKDQNGDQLDQMPILEHESNDKTENNTVVPLSTQSNVVNNQLRTALHFFQNAMFTNCNFTFSMPK